MFSRATITLSIGPHSSFVLFLLSFFCFLGFFLAEYQRSQTGCLPYFHTWCSLSANLECRSEMCCMRLTYNRGRKKSPSRTIAQLCLAISLQLRHIWQSEKNLLNSNISSTCSHNMVNFGPLTAEMCWRVGSLGYSS